MNCHLIWPICTMTSMTFDRSLMVCPVLKWKSIQKTTQKYYEKHAKCKQIFLTVSITRRSRSSALIPYPAASYRNIPYHATSKTRNPDPAWHLESRIPSIFCVVSRILPSKKKVIPHPAKPIVDPLSLLFRTKKTWSNVKYKNYKIITMFSDYKLTIESISYEWETARTNCLRIVTVS